MLKTIYRVVLVTCSSVEEAEKISKTIVEERLAACVNIVPAVKSYFWWNGEVVEAKERLLIIKTKSGRIERLIEIVKKTHGYSIPEIISLPILEGDEEYFKWIGESLKEET